MIDVPMGATPSFMVLFSRMAKKIIEEKYVEKGSAGVADTGASGSCSGQVSKKRKKVSNDEDTQEENELLMEMRKLLLTCTNKLENIEKSGQKSSNRIEKQIVSLQKEVNKSYIGIESKISQVNDEIKGVNICVSKIDNRLDNKHLDIEDGLQKGFNSLWDKTEKFLSPRSHNLARRNKAPSLWKQTLVRNSTAYTVTPRPSHDGGQVIERSGSSTENIFGSAIPRRLFRNERRQFLHENAVVVSYVDPSITPRKMMDIMRKNEVIEKAYNEDESVIEIKRLTKRHMTDDDLKLLKFGVSYRIGANDAIYGILRGGRLFASHWEIRDWVNKDESNGDERSMGDTHNDDGNGGMREEVSSDNIGFLRQSENLTESMVLGN